MVSRSPIIPGMILILAVLLTTTTGAAEKRSSDRLLEARYSMAGLRLGFWGDMADDLPDPDVNLDADLPSAGFYTEIYLDYRLARPLLLELSLGIASRGEIVILDSDNKYIGNINLYPILLQMKFSPLSGRLRTFHPFLVAGGGFVFGRQNIDFIAFGSGAYYDPDITAKTETDFIGVVGGGIDLALSEQLGLNIAAKYHPITFGESLAGIRDYTGISIAAGVSYFLHKW